MSKEKKTFNIQTEADGVVTDYIEEQLSGWFETIEAVKTDDLSPVQKKMLVQEANEWVKWTTRNSELYDVYRFRIFESPKGDVQIVQGKEIDTNP